MFFIKDMHDCENWIQTPYKTCRSSYSKYLTAQTRLMSNINFSVMGTNFGNYLTSWLQV